MNSTRIHPVDRVVAGYNLVLTGVWAMLLGRVSYAPLILIAHLAATFMPTLIRSAPDALSRPTRHLRELYPLVWTLAFWTELDFLRAHLHGTANDAPIAALERAIFGVQLSTEWIARMPHVWLSELMHFSYFAYYPLILLPPIVLAWTRQRTALRDAVTRLTVTYLACYLIYIAFPVDGPHYLAASLEGPHAEGFFYKLVRAVQGFGDSRGAAFPSSHVAGALTIAIIGWRWFSRPVALLLTLEAIGVLLSTVYTQNHYAVDSLTGVVWAFSLQGLVVPAFNRWLQPVARHQQLTPRLPVFTPSLDTTGGGS